MSGLDYSQVPNEKLVEVCSRSLNTIDGLWFLSIEHKYGFDAALELDIEVWRRFSLIHSRRLVKNFALKEDSPIRAFIKLLQADPIMAIQKLEIVMLTDNKAVFRCTECPAQEARIRDGKGLFPCKPVCLAMYTSYAEVVDPKIKLSCLTCPPDVHPTEYWCEWQIET